MTLLASVCAAVLLATRTHPVAVAAVAVSLAVPFLAIVLAVCAIGWSVWRRTVRSKGQGPSEAAVLEGLAAAVGSGATVRQAVMDASSERIGDEIRRSCAAGRPLADVTDAITHRFPETGVELGVVLEQSERIGSRTAIALHELGALAVDAEQRKRDVRVAAAQSRFSAIVVGVVPLLAAVAVVAVRGVPDPGGLVVVAPMVMGAALMVLGSVLVFVTSSKAAT